MQNGWECGKPEEAFLHRQTDSGFSGFTLPSPCVNVDWICSISCCAVTSMKAGAVCVLIAGVSLGFSALLPLRRCLLSMCTVVPTPACSLQDYTAIDKAEDRVFEFCVGWPPPPKKKTTTQKAASLPGLALLWASRCLGSRLCLGVPPCSLLIRLLLSIRATCKYTCYFQQLMTMFVVQSLSRVQLFVSLWIAARQAPLSITVFLSLLRLMSTESVLPSHHLILCCPLSSCPQFSPASGSFPVSQLFASGGQSVGASASASVLLMNIQGWFPLRLTDLISLQSKGLSSLLQHHSSKASILQYLAFFMVQLSRPYRLLEKP